MKKNTVPVKNIFIPLVFAASVFLQASFFPWEHVLNNNRGIKKYSEKKYSEAEELFNKAQKDNPDNENIKFNLADIYYKQKKYIESQSIYLDLLKNAKTDGSVREKTHYNLGNVLYRLGEQSNPEIFWQNALVQYESALSINPDDKNAKENYEFIKNKLKKLNSSTPPPPHSDSGKEQKNNIGNNPKVYSNNPINPPTDNNSNVTRSEAENIMEEMKLEESGMQSFISRRQIPKTEPENKDKSQIIKKDW